MTRRGLLIAAAMLLAAAVAMVVVVQVASPGDPTCGVLTAQSPTPSPPPAPTPSSNPSPDPSSSPTSLPVEPAPMSVPAEPAPTTPAAGRPTVVTVIPDGFSAKHAGHTADGRQFFLTNPFERSDFVALYLFNACGRLLEARIDDMGPRETLDHDVYWKRYDERLAELGDVTFDGIIVQPFAIERFGTTFGFIAEEWDGRWTVSVEPGNYMVFYEPWDTGLYDT
jgi:hypothetical protein